MRDAVARTRQDRAVILWATFAIALSAWLILLTQAGRAHPHAALLAPQASAFGPAELGFAFAMWLAMMVAMMLPAVLPWVLVFAAVDRAHHPERRSYRSVAVFLSGYCVVWALYAFGGALLQLALQQRGFLHPAGDRLGAAAGGLVLVVAGLFQFSTLKAACLDHCRSPMGYFLANWHDGPGAAWWLGARHGLFCVGCCWALMAVMLAVGTMNLFWMALLTVVVCLEKLASRGPLLGRGLGLAFGFWGITLIAGGGW